MLIKPNCIVYRPFKVSNQRCYLPLYQSMFEGQFITAHFQPEPLILWFWSKQGGNIYILRK